MGDMAIEYIADEFRSLGLHIKRVANNDLAVTFYAEGDNTEIEMRIDRIAREFQISAIQDGHTIFPASGAWELIKEYLNKLVGVKSAH